MTQEELDAMMSGDLDEVDETAPEPEAIPERPADDLPLDEDGWPAPAPTDDNKMVHQLDDVTRESEEKSSAIFDIIEQIGEDLMNAETVMQDLQNTIGTVQKTFTTLSEQFPSIQTFKENKEVLNGAIEAIEGQVQMLQDNGDQVMNAMDIMQYQDIHRQKIERVVNVMRALSKYMNTLFSSAKDDSTRVSSAKHIPGDEGDGDVLGNDDIEALLNSLGKE